MWRRLSDAAAALCLILAVSACDDSSCILYNSTYCECTFVNSEGMRVTILDTLTIRITRANGEDSILVNRSTRTNDLSLMLSTYKDVDSIYFDFTDSLGVTRHDTLFIAKTNDPHFESPDCGTTYFHDIQSVRASGPFIKGIEVVHPQVYYNSQDNLKIIF